MNHKHLFLGIALLLGNTITGLSQSSFYADPVTWGHGGSRTEFRNDAGLQGIQGAMSGFYQATDPVNFPPGASSWWHLLDVRHSNDSNNFAMQFSGSFWDQNLYFRKTMNNPSTDWNRVVLEDRYGSANIGRVLTRSLAFMDYDKFNYTNHINDTYSINNYGLEWNGDSWTGAGATAWLSGFGGIKLFTGALCRLSVTAQGNIGIGTSTPQERLSVNGTIASTRVRVTQSGWPDYVFNVNYNLRNLDAVESYISLHKHLPDVPAAAQIAKDGLDIGENQVVLLRKVEELTLYVIQLNKAVRQLQSENKHQKRTLATLTRKK